METLRAKEFLQKGADIFEGWGEDVTEKYGRLEPPGYKKNQLVTFELHLLDRDGGVTRLKGTLRGGDDFFLKWHDKEIVRKYGHLRSNLADFARRGIKTSDNLNKYGMLEISDPDIYYESDGESAVLWRLSSRRLKHIVEDVEAERQCVGGVCCLLLLYLSLLLLVYVGEARSQYGEW